MFKVKDKTGQEIFLKDQVRYEGQADDMGLTKEVDGYVISLPSEGYVQVQPLGEGSPELVPNMDVIVTDSLVQRIANLSDNAELQQILVDAESRHAIEVAAGSKKRGSGRKKAAPIDTAQHESGAIEL